MKYFLVTFYYSHRISKIDDPVSVWKEKSFDRLIHADSYATAQNLAEGYYNSRYGVRIDMSLNTVIVHQTIEA